jgi:hypothetical protein
MKDKHMTSIGGLHMFGKGSRGSEFESSSSSKKKFGARSKKAAANLAGMGFGSKKG